MKKENWVKVLNQESTLFCGAMCLSCLFEDYCPLLVKYKPIVDVVATGNDGTLIVHCSCYVSKEKKSDNG